MFRKILTSGNTVLGPLLWFYASDGEIREGSEICLWESQ